MLFSLMLTAIRFNDFPNTGFLGLTIFGFDLFCKSLGEAVRPGCPPLDRLQCNQQLCLCFVAP
jgi:hypothetical protein